MCIRDRALSQAPFEAVAGDIRAAGVPDALAPAFWAALHENVATRAAIAEWWRMLSEGRAGIAAPEDEGFVAQALAGLGEPPYAEATWGEWTSGLKAATGRKGKGLFLPLRRLVTGRDHGPDMGAVMPLLQVKPSLAQG